MKILLIILGIYIGAIAYGGSAFCEGFESGYKAGYCYNKGYGCMEPMTPMCPMPRMGEDSFQGGYNRGFLLGLSKSR